MTTLHSPMDTEVAHGLKGVVSHATQLSEVDGQAGRLVIRGYDIHELAGKVSFEEAAYLLWYGDLPSRRQLDHVQARDDRGTPCAQSDPGCPARSSPPSYWHACIADGRRCPFS